MKQLRPIGARLGLLLAFLGGAPITNCTVDAGEFLPGAVWRDTDGNPINAHGGGILIHNGTYYWYGESKSGRTFLPDSNKSWGGTRVELSGVSCYSSTNLYDWTSHGLALPAIPADAQSDLHSSKVLERPKVIYNRAAKQFVMWMHMDSADYKAARAGVAVSRTPTGPFRYLSSFRPNAGVWPLNASVREKLAGPDNPLVRDFKDGQMARDLTVFVDDDEKAYLFYASEENLTMHVSALTDDYLHTADKYARIFVGRSMEAPAVFKHNGKYYLIASDCTGWTPNAARLAIADSIFGPWNELGNPCTGKDAEITFQAQSAFVLPVGESKGRFIFMADRWDQWDLADSRHVWLPIEFEGDGKAVLRWRERWSLPDVNNQLRAQRAALKETSN